MVHFAHPELLALFLVLPLMALLRGKKGQACAVRFSSAQVARKLARPGRSKAGKWLVALRFLCLACLIVALSRPQIVKGTTEVEASGIDIMLAVDVSGSMKAMDFEMKGKPVNRLEVVKDTVARFVKDRHNDRIGLIAFAGKPYLVSPLTLDHDWLTGRMEKMSIGMVEDGTAIGSALASAANQLKDRKAKSKIVILLTDGMSNAGKVTPLTAAEAAEALGIKVYTIGAGSHGAVPVPVTDPFGNEQIVTAQVDIDEDTLKEVARMTGAQYYRATDTDSLKNIYAQINKLETTTQKVKKFELITEMFSWVALMALLFLGLELVGAQTRFRRLP